MGAGWWPLTLVIFWHVLQTLPASDSVPCGDQPTSLEHRVAGADVVLSAYTRTTHPREPGGTYAAEFLVLNVLKGDEILRDALRQRPTTALETALSRRLVNVSSFGDKTRCLSDVNPGETYILFLRAKHEHLSAIYHGNSTGIMVYSRENEELIMDALGTRSWGEWSPCSDICGGGIQQRRRLCNGTQRCTSEEGQQRTCNMFSCLGTLDIMEAVGLRRSRLSPADRHSAFRVTPSSSWKVPAHELLPHSFPLEFSLLFTTRVSLSHGGLLFGLYQSGNLRMGLFVGSTVSLILSSVDNVRVTFVNSLVDGKWHQAAFSVRKNIVTFYLDCKQKGKLPIAGKLNTSLDQSAILLIGDPGRENSNVFQGDVEQLLISPDPSAALQQCNSATKPLFSRTGILPLREEVRSRMSSFSGTQNDQLPLRGDIIIDDEDFDFDENGSGFRGDDYENYGTVVDDQSMDKHLNANGVPLKSEDQSDNEKAIDYDDEDIGLIDDNEGDTEEEKEQVEGSGNEDKQEVEWSEWSPCSATCNWGKRTRTSYCVNNGVDLEKCTKGNFVRTEIEACFVKICPPHLPAVTKNFTEALGSVATTRVACNVKCLNGGRCNSLTSCSCPVDYYGNLCQYAHKKNGVCRVTCRNGGTCMPPDTCVCAPGFSGPECQLGCGSSCTKAGLCQWNTGCRCPPGYIPPSCTALCKPTCRNGGVCIAPKKCQCKNGYFGRYCEKASCHQGCKNGGRCVAPGKCACRSGYSGKDCGEPVCEPKCQNGGHCVQPYSCHCPPSTKGAFCEKFVCQPQCQNGGKCIGPGKCLCHKGFSGKQCEKAYCSGGCKNGGRCGKTGKCICSTGYKGLRCETRTCKVVPQKEPYKRGYRKKAVSTEKVPCGPLGWKQCTKTKVHYKMVYKTFYRTTYLCDSKTSLTAQKHR